MPWPKVLGTVAGAILGVLLLLNVLHISLPVALLIAAIGIAAIWFKTWAHRLSKAQNSRTEIEPAQARRDGRHGSRASTS
jgi:ABC-type nickel/cobalt efflux system permease component RcnA